MQCGYLENADINAARNILEAVGPYTESKSCLSRSVEGQSDPLPSIG